MCPDPITNNEGTLCNEDRNTCLDGVCAGSVCVQINRMECQCTADHDQLCDVCCTVYGANGTEHCVSTFDLVSWIKVKHYSYSYIAMSLSMNNTYTYIAY